MNIEAWRKSARLFSVGSGMAGGSVITAACLVIVIAVGLSHPISMSTLTDGFVLLTMCYAFNLVAGALGELSFAHMIFWGLGGYGIVLVFNHSHAIVLWLFVLVACSALGGVILAGVIGVSGLTGLLPISILSIVIAQVAYTFVFGEASLGGANGLALNVLSSYSAGTLFVIAGVVAGSAAVVNLAVVNSRFGRELVAIRDDRIAAGVSGINVSRQRYLVYGLSAVMFALGGAYQSFYAGNAVPDVTLSISPLFVVTLAMFFGGPGTALGPLIGTIVIFGVQAITEQVSSSASLALVSQLVAYGLVLVVLRFVFPKLKGKDLSTFLFERSRVFGRGRPAGGVGRVEAVSKGEILDAVLEQRELSTALASSRVSGSGLEMVNVQKRFGSLSVLNGVSFHIRPGEVVGIIGPNGAGKSTLCNLISGVEQVTAGTIKLDGRAIEGERLHERITLGIGRSFQTPRLFPSLSLADNLRLSQHEMSLSTAESVLGMVGMPDGGRRRGDDPQFFARRLTEIAKATIIGRSVLILDEPLAGLADLEHEIVLGLARGAANEGVCVAIVEHLVPVLAPAVDRMVVLHEGRIIADGPPAVVLKHGEVIDAYLGGVAL